MNALAMNRQELYDYFCFKVLKISLPFGALLLFISINLASIITFAYDDYCYFGSQYTVLQQTLKTICSYNDSDSLDICVDNTTYYSGITTANSSFTPSKGFSYNYLNIGENTIAHEHYHEETWGNFDHSFRTGTDGYPYPVVIQDTYYNELNAYRYSASYGAQHGGNNSIYNTFNGYTETQQCAYIFVAYSSAYNMTEAEWRTAMGPQGLNYTTSQINAAKSYMIKQGFTWPTTTKK